jgi:hypothetical protein
MGLNQFQALVAVDDEGDSAAATNDEGDSAAATNEEPTKQVAPHWNVPPVVPVSISNAATMAASMNERKAKLEAIKNTAAMVAAESAAHKAAKAAEKKVRLKKLAEIKAEKARVYAKRINILLAMCVEACDVLMLESSHPDEMIKKMELFLSVDEGNVLLMMSLAMLVDVYNICRKPAPEWLPELFPTALPQVASSAADAPPPKISAPKQVYVNKKWIKIQKKDRKPKDKEEEEEKRNPDAKNDGTKFRSCGGNFIQYFNNDGIVTRTQASKYIKATGQVVVYEQLCHAVGGARCTTRGCKQNHFCQRPNKRCNCHAFRRCTHPGCNGDGCFHHHEKIHGPWGKRFLDQ